MSQLWTKYIIKRIIKMTHNFEKINNNKVN